MINSHFEQTWSSELNKHTIELFKEHYSKFKVENTISHCDIKWLGELQQEEKKPSKDNIDNIKSECLQSSLPVEQFQQKKEEKEEDDTEKREKKQIKEQIAAVKSRIKSSSSASANSDSGSNVMDTKSEAQLIDRIFYILFTNGAPVSYIVLTLVYYNYYNSFLNMKLDQLVKICKKYPSYIKICDNNKGAITFISARQNQLIDHIPLAGGGELSDEIILNRIEQIIKVCSHEMKFLTNLYPKYAHK